MFSLYIGLLLGLIYTIWKQSRNIKRLRKEIKDEKNREEEIKFREIGCTNGGIRIGKCGHAYYEWDNKHGGWVESKWMLDLTRRGG